MKKEKTIENLAGLDLDWFMVLGKSVIHAASGGGEIPYTSKDTVDDIVEKFISLPDINGGDEIKINLAYVNRVVGTSADRVCNYIRTFVDWAKKGFISYDIVGDSDNTYIWIARPKNKIDISKLPDNIIRRDGDRDFYETFNIS